MTALRWFDHHCHLWGEPDEVAQLVGDANAAGVCELIDVGCDVDGSLLAIERARAFEGVWATAGVHPHEAAGGIDGLDELLTVAEVVAVGECGLDYHYDHAPRDIQRRVFEQQIGLANRHELPLVVHSRDAWPDTLSILSAARVDSVVIHCFTGGPEEMHALLDLGCWISFSGIVTFAGAPEVRQAAVECPLDRLLVETDSPYLAPVPHRGRRNRPAWVADVGASVAAAKGRPTAEVAAVTRENARAAYRLARPDHSAAASTQPCRNETGGE